MPISFEAMVELFERRREGVLGHYLPVIAGPLFETKAHLAAYLGRDPANRMNNQGSGFIGNNLDRVAQIVAKNPLAAPLEQLDHSQMLSPAPATPSTRRSASSPCRRAILSCISWACLSICERSVIVIAA